MRALVLDKIASVTSNCRLSREVKVADELPCKEGDVVAVRVLSSKATYDQLELTTGRMCQVRSGDILAGALGHRNALRGYAGHLPASLQVGDRVQLLNLGGVIGHCDSINPDLGAPFECEVLGQVLTFPYTGERIGVPANIARGLPPADEQLRASGVPIIAFAGTSMSAGKTAACASLTQELTRMRKRVHVGKATGVSLRRDILAMEDAGAAESAIFTDLGVVTTTAANSAGLARTLLNRLAVGSPDIILLELGDGILGSYGVDAILADASVRAAFSAVVLAANDPVGAWGGARLLREEYGIELAAVTGPATDNVAGTRLIEDVVGVPAVNARTEPARLAEVLMGIVNGVTGGGGDGS